MLKTLFVSLFLLKFICEANAESRTNFKITRFELCQDNAPLLIKGNITTQGQNQYLTSKFEVPINLDENVGFTWKIDGMMGQNLSTSIFTIRERNFCLAMNKYLGEFWYNILRAAQLIPGACPIPAGKYHVENVHLNYKRITLQTFPFGTLHFVWKIFNNRTPKNALACIFFKIENTPN